MLICCTFVQVGRIVGRDTASLSGQEIRLAALETLSENLSDGVVAPFWAGELVLLLAPLFLFEGDVGY